MPSLRRGLIEKGIYYVDGLCAIQILLGRDSDPLPGGDLYARGTCGEAGTYMLVDTVGVGSINPHHHDRYHSK
jgi:hypothetical protein